MRRYVLTPLKWLGATAFWCVVVSVLWVLLLGAVDPPVTWIMVQQSNEQKDFARTWKDLDEISLWMPLAVIASEDQKFMDHNGFDMEALEKAWAEYDKPKRRSKLKGASTISQQTAKNVFLWDGRTLLRKGIEAWFTLLIETFWNKERILEVYLNVAETGAGRFGAEAAAQHCFGKPAAKLSQSQTALIAVLLPSPRGPVPQHPTRPCQNLFQEGIDLRVKGRAAGHGWARSASRAGILMRMAAKKFSTATSAPIRNPYG